MNPTAYQMTVVLGAAMLAASALAQGDDGGARQRYDRAVAACNSGDLPAPQRNGCVRAAGSALDRALGGAPPETPRASADGRATVVSPPGAAPPSGGSGITTSSDGRATIVPPADRTAPR